MKKAYYYLFYKLDRFGKAISDDVLSSLKPLLAVIILELVLAIQLLMWYTVITKDIRDFSPLAQSLTYIIAALLALFQYYDYKKSKWRDCIIEFTEYDKRKKYLGSLVVLLFVVAIFSGLVMSFNFMSKIDWSKYR